MMRLFKDIYVLLGLFNYSKKAIKDSKTVFILLITSKLIKGLPNLFTKTDSTIPTGVS